MNEEQVLRSMMRDDSYRVLRVLGEGPSGRTELVTLDGSDLLVRKRIPERLGNAAAWAALMGEQIPGLPRIESIYQMPDELVVVYAYVEGDSLRTLIERDGPLSPQRATTIVCDVCEAAGALHARGIIHRDIAPGNVIVAADRAYLVDLGIARQHAEGRERDTTALGTWGFAAPEQFGFAQTDQRSDVYSLGRLLGYVLTATNPADDAYSVRLADPALVRPALEEVVTHATSFEPSARYQSAHELADAIRAAQTQRVSASRLSTTAWMEDKATGSARRERPAESNHFSHAPEPESASPTANTRKFFAAPLWERIVVILVWLFLGFWEYVIARLLYESVMGYESTWEAQQQAMSVALFGGLVLISLDVYRVVTRRGPYAYTQRVLRTHLQKTCIVLAIVFILLFVAVIVFPGQKT